MVKLIHKERIAEGSTRRFLDGRRNDVAPRKHMVAKFRESHHMVAKLFAAGLRGKEIAARTGYGENWLAQLHNDPAFQELLSKYRDLDTQMFLEGRDEFYSLATKNMIQAERQLSDKMDELDEEGEFLPTRELVAVVADRADRFGYGKRETKFNVNVDFADALQRAIKRSGKTIDGQASEGLGGMKLLSKTETLASHDEGRMSSELLAPTESLQPVPRPEPGTSLVPGDPNQVDGVGNGYFGSTPQAEQSVVACPSPSVPRLGSLLGSAEGPPSLGRSVEAPQEGLVLPGVVEPQPSRRRRLLG